MVGPSEAWAIYPFLWLRARVSPSVVHVDIHKSHFPSSLSLVPRPLGTRLVHHARHTGYSVFTALWCGSVSSPDPILALASIDTHLSSTYQGIGTSRHNGTNNAQTPPYYEHVSSSRIPGLYHIQGIDRIEMVDVHNVK